jgi:aminomethyltransferase
VTLLQPATPARPVRPGPGLERYPVTAGGATVVGVRAGDLAELTDVHGGQAAEVLVIGAAGEDLLAAAGAAPDGPASALAALARSPHPDADLLTDCLAGLGVIPDTAMAAHLFGRGSRAGDVHRFVFDADATLVVMAPGGPMEIDGAGLATDLTIMLQRAVVPESAPGAPAPLLAEPSLDLVVDASTARAYEVKAGDYVQVVDLEGRQCSDFMAFDRRALDAGIERGIDSTATRTLMGRTIPRPGLYSKFFDGDLTALVEVVRDTVGRHDTFGYACTSKYYDDRGYFGHPNCSDNFNAVLEPYRVQARRGWPAINFFFNTFLDSDTLIFLDEPWSRPGDYVLLRAETDLVCVSSACPDDIDPANGWVPTPIGVRIYPSSQNFSRGVAHRVTANAEPVLTKDTGFTGRIRELTGRLTEYRGYWLPTSYAGYGAEDEYWACRERVAVCDLSPLRKFEVLGPDAESLLQAVCTRDIRRLSVNKVVYTAICNDTGGMMDDATVYRLDRDNFRFVGGDEHDGIWMREQAARLGLDQVWVRPSTDNLHNIAVQGPRSREVLADLIWTTPSQPAFLDLGWFSFTIGRLGGPAGIPLMVSRTGYTGELGYEVWCHPDSAPQLWDAVFEAGAPHRIAPLGLDALDMLRIESGLIFAHYEFDDQVDPFEAGIGFAVGLTSTDEDFVGRASIERRKASPSRVLVGLELEGNETAGHGDCVHLGRPQVGVVTSGTRSPSLRKNIALARVAVEHSEVGTRLEIGKLDGLQKRIPATVVRFPFYDPGKERPRS